MTLRPSTKQLLLEVGVLLVFSLIVEASILLMARGGAFTPKTSQTLVSKTRAIGVDQGDEALLSTLSSGLTRVIITWEQVEPAPQAFNYAALDPIKNLSSKGVSVIVALEARSSWATTCSQDQTTVKKSCSPINSSEYQGFVGAVAKNLKGKSVGYEIESSLDNDGFSGNFDEYIALLKVAATAIHAGDRSAKVYTATLETDPANQIKTLSAQANSSFGGVVLAAFGAIPDTLASAKTMRAQLANKQLIVLIGGPDIKDQPTDETTQAAQVVAKTIGALSAGADKVLVYKAKIQTDGSIRQKTLGLQTAQGGTTLAQTALEQLIRLTQGYNKISIFSKAPQIVRFSFSDDRLPLYTFWSAQDGSITPPADLNGRIRLFELNGKVTTQTDGSITIGAQPLLAQAISQ